jgi:hypothetical protein
MDKSYSLSRSFNKEYNNFFEKNNFIIIDPSQYTCIQLYIILNNAKTIVTSWGCISWINRIIIDNNNLNYILLSHNGYTHEFPFCYINYFIPSCKNCSIVYNLPSEFNDEVKSNLEILLQ